jgi:magnesium/cobalt transport protein CorA
MTLRTCLYRADEPDLEVELEPRVIGALNERQLLWIDLASPDSGEIARVAQLLDFRPGALRLPERVRRPTVENYGHCFSLTVYAALDRADGHSQAKPMTLVAGENFVVSVHNGDLPFIDELRRREKGDTRLGELTSESFVASLLDWQLSTFFHAVERIEHDVDVAEVAILGRQQQPTGFLRKMVAARQEISELRRLLKPHRDVFYALARPDFTPTEAPETRPHYRALINHFERAEDALESARDLVVGSFDLFSTRAAQRTNETMRALTFVTVLMGSLSLIAGILGMNFDVPFFTSGEQGFYTVMTLMGAVVVGALAIGRWRRWY